MDNEIKELSNELNIEDIVENLLSELITDT